MSSPKISVEELSKQFLFLCIDSTSRRFFVQKQNVIFQALYFSSAQKADVTSPLVLIYYNLLPSLIRSVKEVVKTKRRGTLDLILSCHVDHMSIQHVCKHMFSLIVIHLIVFNSN
jgi:hypothetical protein